MSELSCPRCADDMRLSKAIKPLHRMCWFPGLIKAEHLQLIDVYKCVGCGHTEQTVEQARGINGLS